MPKTAVFTTITPLPAGITRKSVLDMYRDHVAMIDLNPLVVERFACRPPKYAPTDEYWSTWYTIKDKISYLPGGLAQGSVSYHACFKDSKVGLETHVYAPLGLEIRSKWSVGGRLPGEPLPPVEPGLRTPRHGLYIREDVQMTCSSLLLAFVRKTFKDSHSRLVVKLVERAHILESNFANERLQALRNIGSGQRMSHGDIFIAPPPDYEYSGQTSLTTLPRYVSHLRCQSDPVVSPGFSSSATLYNQNEKMLSFSKDEDRPISFRFILEEKPISSSAPEPNSFLLPPTSYTNDSAKPSRPPSICPNLQTERIISLLPFSPCFSHEDLHFPQEPHHSSEPDKHPTPEIAPYLSYEPQDRPISFTFSFDPRSPFDTRSTSESPQSSQQQLLNDIDDAIDEVFNYTSSSVSATTPKLPLPMPCNVLPATPFGSRALTVLPQATYVPERERKDSAAPMHEAAPVRERQDSVVRMHEAAPVRERKDSVVPPHEYADKALPALPPAPLKDEKWRKKSRV